MSDVYQVEIVLPSTMGSRVMVSMNKAERRFMGTEPWIVREYGFGTTDNGDWHDTAANAWDAAAEQLAAVVARYQEQIASCRAEAVKARETVAA